VRTDTDSRAEMMAADEPIQVEHVGALLCATRMRMGGDLQEVAKVLRIRYGYLVAIEDGRYEDLPGAAYSVGFVRAYADYLGLDGNEVVRRLRVESAGTGRKARYEFPVPSGESGLPNGGLLAIAIGLGMVVYGTWYTMSAADQNPVELIQEVPARLAVLLDDQSIEQIQEERLGQVAAPGKLVAAEIIESSAPNSAPSSPSSPPPSLAMTVVDETNAFEIWASETGIEVSRTNTEQEVVVSDLAEQSGTLVTAALDDADAAVEIPGSRAQTIVATLEKTAEETSGTSTIRSSEPLQSSQETDQSPSVEPEPASDSEESEAGSVDEDFSLDPQVAELALSGIGQGGHEDLIIELRAKSDSWIQVRDGDDLLLTRLLRQGEVYTVPDRNGLTLMTSNAGGLEVFVDGELMPPLGDVGVVHRGVPLSADRLRTGIEPG
jgi:cytoskeleton protein RodZ